MILCTLKNEYGYGISFRLIFDLTPLHRDLILEKEVLILSLASSEQRQRRRRIY